MKTISMIILLFSISINVYAEAGDGTLPVIRSINVEFLQGQLREQLQLPECVNLKINPKDIKGKKLLKNINIKKSKLQQTIKVEKQNGLLNMQINSSLKNNQGKLQSRTRGLSNSQFMNEVQISQSKLIQAIQLNEVQAGCLNLK